MDKQILVPIFICAIMPICIVLIVAFCKIVATRSRAEILIKAIETGSDVNIDKLAEALGRPRLSPEEQLTRKLLRGCIFTLIGLVGCICGIIAWCSGAEFYDDPVCLPVLLGGISMAVGISFLVVYFITRRRALPHAEDNTDNRDKDNKA